MPSECYRHKPYTLFPGRPESGVNYCMIWRSSDRSTEYTILIWIYLGTDNMSLNPRNVSGDLEGIEIIDNPRL